MNFGHDMRVQWGGDVDDSHMQSTTFPPAMEFGTLVREQLPQGALYNPGPTPQDATTDMFGAPSGELIIGAHDSKIHDPSYTPIVHSLLVKDLGGKGKFYPKGQLVLVTAKDDPPKMSRRRMMRKFEEHPTPCVFQHGFQSLAKDIQGVYPLSEGIIFPKTSDTERVAITVHDHAEVITCDPREVKSKIDPVFYTSLETDFPYYKDAHFYANINSSLWVTIFQEKNNPDELVFIPVVDPPAGKITNIMYHIGTLKQAYTPDDDTWIVSFAPV